MTTIIKPDDDTFWNEGSMRQEDHNIVMVVAWVLWVISADALSRYGYRNHVREGMHAANIKEDECDG